MTNRIFWIFIIALTIACGATGNAETNVTADAIKKLVELNIRVFQAEDLDAVLGTMHSQSPDILGMKQNIPTIFDAYDINTQLTSFAFIGQNDDYAVARIKMKSIKISGPAFHNAETDSICIFRLENSEWKNWTQVILDIHYLNE